MKENQGAFTHYLSLNSFSQVFQSSERKNGMEIPSFFCVLFHIPYYDLSTGIILIIKKIIIIAICEETGEMVWMKRYGVITCLFFHQSLGFPTVFYFKA
jgi:hypothetical protein